MGCVECDDATAELHVVISRRTRLTEVIREARVNYLACVIDRGSPRSERNGVDGQCLRVVRDGLYIGPRCARWGRDGTKRP